MNIINTSVLLTLILATGATAQEWFQEKTTVLPAARRFHSLEYDTARHESLLFGGVDESKGVVMDDTWGFDGTRWHRHPAKGPTARYQHAACFDSSGRRLLVFGGVDSLGGILGDMWSFDGKTWMRLSTKSGPSPRASAGMAYDSKRNRVVLFGGRDAKGTPLGETWEFDGLNWLRRTSPKVPDARFGHALAYDSHRGVTALFGGRTSGSSRFSSETWLWNGTSWVQKKSTTTPGTMIFPAAAFHSDHKVILVTGSAGSLAPAISTWAFDGTDWHRGPSAPAGLFGRQGHGLTFDVARQSAVLFGGASISRGGALPHADTWELSTLAQALPFGSGCSTRLGKLELVATGKPSLGSSLVMELRPLPKSSLPFLALGVSNKKYLGLPLPMTVHSAGKGCQLLVSIDKIDMLNQGGRSRLPIPLRPTLLGKELFAQGLVFGPDPALSHGLKIVIGN